MKSTRSNFFSSFINERLGDCVIYAPMVIPTLCRADHFIRCIESLKRNTWAKYTEIYVALDYPSKDCHWEGYHRINEYLKGEFSEFANIIVLKRERNFGASENARDAYAYVWRKYDRFIRCDDDCVFSPDFLEYMDKCLERYKDNPEVLAVTGYSYPVAWKIKDNCNAFLGRQIFPMWGTGLWRDKYIEMRSDIEGGFIKDYVLNKPISVKKMTTARYVNAINGALTDNTNDFTKFATDVGCGIYIQLKDKYIVTPIKSKVRNTGFDGTGLSCPKVDNYEYSFSKLNAENYLYSNQPIDMCDCFDPNIDETIDFDVNKRVLDEFDYTPISLIIKAKIKLWIFKILGEKNYKKIIGVKSKYGK